MTSRAPIIGVVVALLLAVAFFFLLYQPRNDELDAIRAETAELETQRTTLTNELRRLEDIAAREVEFRAALARVEDYLPTGVAQSAVIRELQVAADRSGVTINTLSFTAPVAVEEAPPTGSAGTVLGAVGVTMTVDGGYFQMVDFLRRLEVDVARAILVDDVAVAESSEGYPLLSTTWSGEMFAVIPDPEPQPAPPADDDPADGEAEGDEPEDEAEGDQADGGDEADDSDDAGDA